MNKLDFALHYAAALHRVPEKTWINGNSSLLATFPLRRSVSIIWRRWYRRWLGTLSSRLPIAQLDRGARGLLATREFLGKTHYGVRVSKGHLQIRLNLIVTLQREEEMDERHVIATCEETNLLLAPKRHCRWHIPSIEIQDLSCFLSVPLASL